MMWRFMLLSKRNERLSPRPLQIAGASAALTLLLLTRPFGSRRRFLGLGVAHALPLEIVFAQLRVLRAEIARPIAVLRHLIAPLATTDVQSIRRM